MFKSVVSLFIYLTYQVFLECVSRCKTPSNSLTRKSSSQMAISGVFPIAATSALGPWQSRVGALDS